MSEWIDIKDKLPEKMTRVIIYDEGGFGSTCGRLSHSGYWYVEDILDKHANITHWQPLPEPPK